MIIVKLCGESDSNETGKLVCLENNNELYKIRITKKCYLKLVLERLGLVPKFQGDYLEILYKMSKHLSYRYKNVVI